MKPTLMRPNHCPIQAVSLNLIQMHIHVALGRTADVQGYDKSYEPIINIPIVTGATAYGGHLTGKTYILLFHESLYYGMRMDHSLFNPNQISKYDISVWDNPFDLEISFTIQVNDDPIRNIRH